MGSRLEQASWELRFGLEQKRAILEKRIALIERVTTIVNKEGIVKLHRNTLDAESKIAGLAAQCSMLPKKDAQKHNGCNPMPQPNVDRATEATREILLLNTEFAALASLCQVFFGPKTRSAALALAKTGPFDSDSGTLQALLNAMGEELNDFQAKRP